jgi:vancomycin permeability regulator SanA
MSPIRITLIAVILLGSLLALMAYLPGRFVAARYASQIITPELADHRPVAIVFGAGLRADGRPTRVLEDRVRTASELYLAGNADKLLLSGASNGGSRNETEAMLDLALQLGVPREDILLDPEGTRTFETCLQARSHWSIQEAHLVTQRFHLPRAMVICDALGMDVTGVSADLRTYSRFSMTFWQLREIPALLRALCDLRTHNQLSTMQELPRDKET